MLRENIEANETALRDRDAVRAALRQEGALLSVFPGN